MSNRYAVASGDWSNTTTVWSDTDGGVAGSFVPIDGDAVFISAGVSVKMDVDQSAFVGLFTVTVRGGATPGMLYWSGASGHLKIRDGYNLVGTNDTNNGRVLANSDGVWATTTALAYADKAIIDLQGASKIECVNLDFRLYCDQPTVKKCTVYGTKKTVTSVDSAADTLTVVGHGYAAGQTLSITSSTTLPGGLYDYRCYYVRSTTTDTFKLAETNSDAAIVDLSSTGSGTIEVYDGIVSGSATVNVLEDVTADNWTAGDYVVLVDDRAPENCDQQRLTVSTINSGSLVLSAVVDSDQYPGAGVYLIQRNIAIRSTSIVSSQRIIDAGTGGIFQCEIHNTSGSGTTFYGYGVYQGTSHTISGTVSGCYFGVYVGTSHTISGMVSGCNRGINGGLLHTISGIVNGCEYGVNTGTLQTISGTMSGCSYCIVSCNSIAISGTVSGCSYGTMSCNSSIVSGNVSGCSYGVNLGTCICNGATFTGNTVDFENVVYAILHGSEIGSTTQVNDTDQTTYPFNGGNPAYVHSYDTASGGTVNNGSLAYWNQGGSGVSHAYVEGTDGDLQASGWDLPDPDWIHTATFDTVALPTGAVTCPLWIDIPIQAVDGETINFEVNVKLSTTADWDALPRVQIVNLGKGWMVAAGVLQESIASASSGWQNLTVAHTATAEQQLALRIYGTRTVRNGSFDWCWRQVLPVAGSTTYLYIN